VDQYVLEKEILPANDANKESLASELTTRLVNRFRGELEDEIADFRSLLANFTMIPGEKVEKGVDRFNGIVQKLNRHNRGPTADAKKEKLREALEIPALESLWVAISMLDNPSFETIVATSCRRYDKVSTMGVKFILLPQQKQVVKRDIMDTHEINSTAKSSSKLKW
jgi:hypothetical protein